VSATNLSREDARALKKHPGALVLATYESRHFDWIGVGLTAEGARRALVRAWNDRAAEPWDPADNADISYIVVWPRSGFRDKTMVVC